MESNGHSLIFAIVNKGFSEEVMTAARNAGATGGTIVNARGTGNVEIAKFLGIVIEPEKEMILILTGNAKRQQIMAEIHKAVGLTSGAGGFAFSVPVEHILGKHFASFTENEPKTEG